MANKRLIELTGQRFGKLVVIEYAGRNERRESLWCCLCDCGNESIVRGDVLRRGTTESCGCGKGLKHGHHKNPWYSSYKAMMERCYLPSCGNYKRYGGKGVTVCEEWHDINKFAEWVETSGYAPGLTIDRIDPLGNYEPSNCQWLTRSENSKNSLQTEKREPKKWWKWYTQNGLTDMRWIATAKRFMTALIVPIVRKSSKSRAKQGNTGKHDSRFARSAVQRWTEGMRMANTIKKGESLFIPFKNGESIYDSQLKPRMYKTKEQYDRFGYHFKDAEMVEYAEVVRCKDCKHLEITGCYGECRKLVRIVMPWDFCSYGERREGE